MQKVKALVWLLLLAAGVGGMVLVARSLLGSSSEWEGLGDSPSPAASPAAAPEAAQAPEASGAPEPPRTLPEGYDPLTDPIPPNEL